MEQPPQTEPNLGDAPDEPNEDVAESPPAAEPVDVFFSYSRRDAARVAFIIEALGRKGFRVWWDLRLRTGSPFSRVIREKLNVAKCAVVVWSSNSVNSTWVEAEATLANQRGVLVPVMIDDVAGTIPIPFNTVETAALFGPDGPPPEEMESFLASVSDLVRGSAAAAPATPQPPEGLTAPPPEPPPWYVRYRRLLLAVVGGAAALSLLLAAFYPLLRGSAENTNNFNIPNPNARVTPVATPRATPGPTGAGQAVGIDISHFNGIVKWAEVNKGFVSFVMIKATQGEEGVDRDFGRNWEGAKSVGIIRGAYHFLTPDADATAQANNFAQHVRLEPGDLPPVLDVEPLQPSDKMPSVGSVRTWLRLVERMTGRKPIIYTGKNFWDESMSNEFGEYPLWVAQYGSPDPTRLPKGWSTWTFWQYEYNQRVTGVGTPVSTTFFNGTPEELRAFVSR